MADVIADVVETGTTLRQAGLEMFGEPILVSDAVLVRRSGSAGADPAWTPPSTSSSGGCEGVIVARTLRDDGLRRARPSSSTPACALTPGIESPTVSPLHREGWVAVRAMVPRRDTNPVMDALYDLGARGILVTDIHACRL